MRIQNELELAHSIQRTLVPTLEIRTPRFEVYGISQPSEKVGGDLVDAISLSNGDLVAFLADVSGHGLPASILMGRVKTAARTALLDACDREPAETLPGLAQSSQYRFAPGEGADVVRHLHGLSTRRRRQRLLRACSKPAPRALACGRPIHLTM